MSSKISYEQQLTNLIAIITHEFNQLKRILIKNNFPQAIADLISSYQNKAILPLISIDKHICKKEYRNWSEFNCTEKINPCKELLNESEKIQNIKRCRSKFCSHINNISCYCFDEYHIKSFRIDPYNCIESSYILIEKQKEIFILHHYRINMSIPQFDSCFEYSIPAEIEVDKTFTFNDLIAVYTKHCVFIFWRNQVVFDTYPNDKYKELVRDRKNNYSGGNPSF